MKFSRMTTEAPAARRMAGGILWLIWVAAAGVLTAPVYKWHLDYFRSSPNPAYYRIAMFAIPALGIAAMAYAGLRRRGWWRSELVTLAVAVTLGALVYEPKAAIVTFLTFLSCSAAGRFCVQRLGLDLQKAAERIAIGFAGGCGLLIPVLFLLGLAHLLYPATFLILLLGPPMIFQRETIGCLRDLIALLRGWRNAGELRHPIVGVSVFLGALGAGCTVVMAVVPTIGFDALQMHLPIARYYSSMHVLEAVPGIDYSYYPQGMEALWALSDSLAGQPGVQMLSALFFGLFLLSVWMLARAAQVNRAAAAVGVIWAGMLPFLQWTGSAVKNDMALALFQALALYVFARWLEGRDFRWIWVGAFFLAQTFSIKHVAVFGAVPLAALFAYAAWRQPRRWRAALTVVLIVACFGGYWAARTYLLTGNPVYPSMTENAAPVGAVAHQHSISLFTRYTRIPAQIIFAGKTTFESPLNNPAGIVLLVFVPLMLWSLPRRGNPARWAYLFFTGLYLLLWATILTTLRYAIVPFAMMALLAAASAVRFHDAQKGAIGAGIRGLGMAAGAYSLLVALMGILILETNGAQIAYLAHRLDRDRYLKTVLPTYASLEYLRDEGVQASVLGVDNCSRAYAPDPFRFQCVLCPPEGCRVDAVVAQVERQSPQYLILPVNRLGAEVAQKVSDVNSARRVYQDRNFEVYELPGAHGAERVAFDWNVLIKLASSKRE